MLTKSYLLHGDDVYLLQRHPTTVAQLARLVQAYTAFCVHGRPAPYTDGDLETLGIYAAVLAGLCATLALLPLLQRVLPALPISIAIGVGFYFASAFAVTPMAHAISAARVVL